MGLSDDLKDWAENLEQRQDEIIGPSYFETPGDLRWNHYLYLLASKEASPGNSYDDLKRTIEGDRSYARKFVLTEEELPEALKSLEPARVVGQGVTGPDVVGRWTKRLLNAQLGIVLEQRPVAETVREISKGSENTLSAKAEREHAPRALRPLATRFLDAVELVRFRQWPDKQVFESLGSVNLIVGSNGVGKTTLLEGIEYLYCQENARTPSPAQAHVKVRLKGLPGWQETRSTAQTAEAKQRNLDWYGQRDLRGSTLANSFSRFNFLSTDEAAILGQKNAKISFEDLLSRLVAGPQAAELWDHLSRLGQPLAAERARLASNISDAKQRKLTLESLIQAAAAAPSASDSDLSALAEDLSRLGWLGVVTRANVASEAAPELNRAYSLARELLTAKLGLVRVARKDLLDAREAADVASVEVERILKEVADADGQANADAVEKMTLAQTIQNIESIKAAQQVNAFGLIAEFDRLKQEIGVLRPLIGGENLPTGLPNWIQEQKQPLTDALVSARRQSTSLAAQVEELDARLAALRTTQNATASMLLEIRALAKRLLEHNPNHTNCPVCATAFDLGELERRLALTAAKTADDQTAIVLNTLGVIREQYASFDAMRRALIDLETYSKLRGLDPSVRLAEDILQEYHVQQASFKALQAQHGDITLRLSALSSAGLSDETIRTLQQAASRMDIDVLSQEEVARALSRESLALEQLDASTVQRSNERAALVSRMVIVVRSVEEVAEPIDTVVKAFRDRRTLIHSAVALIDELQTRFALGDEADIAAIAPLLDSAKVSAERFVKALESESNSRASEANAKQQLVQVESRTTEYELAESRVEHAIEILSALEKEDSLLSATDAELLSVQAETNAVFGRIHSPHEYGVRRHAQAPLYRLEDPTQAVTLRDVSTGQRAAFVLSVFLAMNAKLQTAPPVLLFDDPVAHIDDFNSLSFLDHLRDIALDGKRQIFYATADNRLAGLFEHKFSFMKEKFRRFDLVR